MAVPCLLSAFTAVLGVDARANNVPLAASPALISAATNQRSLQSADFDRDGDAGQQFTARDGGRVTTEANTASGGSIDIRARQLIYIRDGELTTSVAGGSEDGGNIMLDPEFVVFDHATVVARAVAGNGGNIVIQTSHYVPDVASVVAARARVRLAFGSARHVRGARARAQRFARRTAWRDR